VFIAQRAKTCSAQNKKPAGFWFKPKPPRGKHSQEVPAGEKQDVTSYGPDLSKDTIGSFPHLPRGLAPWASISEQAPLRPLSENLNGPAAFVLAVVPLEQITLDLGNCSKASQLARSRYALQRAGQNFREGQPTQPLPEAAGVALAPLG
jgi:hypothetical protein